MEKRRKWLSLTTQPPWHTFLRLGPIMAGNLLPGMWFTGILGGERREIFLAIVVADILTANSKNSAHRFLPFMARYVILPLSRRLLSVFLRTTSAPATFVVCRVREDKYAQSFMTLTQIVQISEWESVSAARRTLCCVQLSLNQGQIQESNNFLTWCQNLGSVEKNGTNDPKKKSPDNTG